MYRRIAAILFPIAVIALIGTVVWGYQENQDKNAVLIKAENQYQRAFHELNFHLDQLQDELGKTLVLQTRPSMVNCLTNVWRLTYAAQSDLSQLPLTLMPFNKTEEFLSKMGDFSFRVGLRDLDKQPLTDKEWGTLRSLYERASQVQTELQKVQSQVLSRNLRWMDVELALATEGKKMDTTIIDGFRKVDNTMDAYSEVDWGPTIHNQEARKKQQYVRLPGKPATVQEVKNKLAFVLGRPSTRGIVVTENRKGDFQTYSARLKREDGYVVYADFTKKGGYLVWLMFDRPVERQRLSIGEAQQRASRFLNRLGYPTMRAVSYDSSQRTATFTFVHQERGVLIYPETVTVKVALDNGEIMALQANDYVFNHPVMKSLHRPRLSAKQAEKAVNPRLNLEKSNLAVIYGEDGNPVLCYEFVGWLGDDQYRIFINADNGREEFVDKVKKADTTSL
ncbi:germination protein YpeB [Polycladomyces sp. WAk]|uniref:Germination protein YpeB n=1 Tax=Polycladomyces zharkentensis TaxID=2807616 RepID=A0ABS2WJH4_9BACL|nr:germination protein YpeB [Polycladomyces sp. WAk]